MGAIQTPDQPEVGLEDISITLNVDQNMTNLHRNFDVIVIGGGHAGCEAALAAARSGATTLLLTHQLDTIGQMSCNPSIGGLGKSQLVKEVDAMGGAMALAIDQAGIQFRVLNASKGPAVRATRAQADRVLYKAAMLQQLQDCANLRLFQQGVDDLIVENQRVRGVTTQTGINFYAHSVVLATGTFLGGVIHLGKQQQPGGRAGDSAVIKLARRLRALPLRVERLKTGTPPRIDKRSIDFSKLKTQPSDNPLPVFSFMGSKDMHPAQIPCHITYTNPQTHAIIREHLHESAMYSGQISSSGPRYCPSIEDKIVRFAEREQHQIFLEPEGLNSNEVYPNGISTSLPFAVQEKYVRSIAGLEQAHITRPGYAIEYDFLDPRDLMPSLESKCIAGLFMAGQINGTTGYEEAAAQGLLAGVNAACAAQQRAPLILHRHNSYLGVLIDDLISRGTSEPYRMFTSRAEYRLLLREDNADLRLTPLAQQHGLITPERWQAFQTKQHSISAEQERLAQTWIQPNTPAAQAFQQKFQQKLEREYNAMQLLTRPEVNYRELMQIPTLGPGLTCADAAAQVMTQAKYAGYINRQQQEIERLQSRRQQKIPKDFAYDKVSGLSCEIQQKLSAICPTTIGQASDIPGVTPAAISLLLVYLKKRQLQMDATESTT